MMLDEVRAVLEVVEAFQSPIIVLLSSGIALAVAELLAATFSSRDLSEEDD